MKRAVCLITCLLCFAPVARSQGFTLTGEVSTERDSAVVRVVLENPKVKADVRNVDADAEGNYEFRDLSGREYRLIAFIDGKKQSARKIEIFCRPGGVALKDFDFGDDDSTLSLSYPAEDPDVVDLAEIQGDLSEQVRRDFERAHRDYSGGKVDRAIERLEALIARAPRFYKAHALLGLAYQDAGCYQDAEAEYAIASDLNPRGVHPLLNLASAQLRFSDAPGRHDGYVSRALATLEKALKVRPTSALVYCLMGSAHSKIDAWEEAERSLLRALEIENSGMARLMLGNLYGKQRNWTAAAEQLKEYLDENPFAENRPIVKRMLSEAEKNRSTN